MADRIPFHNRGERMSRIDGFSDVVFGFALTLLVVSLEVPHTYGDLINSLRGFLPFAICFAILIQIWHTHYVFFRRYGLEDTPVILLNCVLLFVVLLYVYPLKFLWRLLIEGAHENFSPHQARVLLTFYGAGFAAIWIVLYMMFRVAYSRRNELGLNLVEVTDTRQELAMCLSQAGVGVFAVLLALVLPDRIVGLSGLSYMLLGVTNTWVGAHFGKQRRVMEDRMLKAKSAAVPV